MLFALGLALGARGLGDRFLESDVGLLLGRLSCLGLHWCGLGCWCGGSLEGCLPRLKLLQEGQLMSGWWCRGHAGKPHKPRTWRQRTNEPNGLCWGPLRPRDGVVRARWQAKYATGPYHSRTLRQSRGRVIGG